MKKSFKLKYITIYFAIIGSVLIQSCNSDETYDVMGDTVNKVYINTQSWGPIDAPKNSFLFNVTNTPAGSIITNAERIEVNITAQCTQVASSDINVEFEIDNSLTTEGYSLLPDNVSLTMDKTSLTIPKGMSKSNDNLTISVDSDDLSLLSVDSYMIPVKITSVTNAELSSNLISAFVIVKTTFSNCTQLDELQGTAADRTGWAAMVNGSDQGNRLFDDNRRTYFYGSNFTLEIDMGTVIENITGIMMSYYSSSYSIGSANIYTSSTTTDEYELQGSPVLSRASPQNVGFYEAVDARYIKVEVTSSYSSSGTAITEFSAYKE